MKPYLLKILLLFALLTAKTNPILAQTHLDKWTLKGKLADSLSSAPLAFITIKLNDDKGKTIGIGLTKEDGTFNFSGLASSTYQIIIVAMGYPTKAFPLNLQKDTDLGLIHLLPQLNHLKEIAVIATPPLIRQKTDRLIYDLKADPESKSSSVLGILHKIPYITVDGQDNILLKGNPSFRIFINGRPSPSVERNFLAVLKSMPASSIESIEVITTPPSKYDGEGLAGIINIITVKHLNNGYSGTLNASQSFPAGGPGAGASFTAKSGRLMISSFGGGNLTNTPETGFTNSRSTSGTAAGSLIQEGDKRSKHQTAYFGTEISYEVDSLQLISGQFHLNGNQSTDDQAQHSALYGNNGIVQAYQLLNNNQGKNYGWDAAINYQIGFKSIKNRLLTFSYQYSDNRNIRDGNINTHNQINFNLPDYTQTDKQKFNEHTFQVDFITPLKRLNIEAGVKGILRQGNSNFGYSNFDSTSGQFVQNNALSNQYSNQQHVFSAYNSYQLNLKTWSINAGVRLEQTMIKADFSSTATAADQNYLHLLPSISAMKNFSNQTALNFGYSQRLRRPGINRLNPYIDRSNPNFESTGNPNLRPVLLNDIQLGYSSNKKISLNVGLNYSFMKNLDLRVTDFDPETQITRTSYENTGKSSSLGSNLSISYPLGKVYQISLNGNVMYLWLQGMADGIAVENNQLMYSFSLSNGFHLNKGWVVNAGFNIVSRNPTGLQGYSNGFVGTAFSVNKEMIKNKLDFAARMSNPFTRYRPNEVRSFGPDFNQLYTSAHYYRSFGISLNYKFGRLSNSVSKSRRTIENKDIAN